MESLKTIDQSALKTNQAAIIVLSITAFILNSAWLTAIIAVMMLLGTIFGNPGFAFLYNYALKPSGIVKPDWLLDNPEPHRFAQGLGGIIVAVGSLLLFGGLPILGWSFVWIVIALAGLNLFVGFCAGCAVYYWLSRLGLPGFEKSTPQGTFTSIPPKEKG